MRFLADAAEAKAPFPTWPRYASGNVYFANFFDSLMAQSFFNNEMLSIIASLITPEDEVLSWAEGPNMQQILAAVTAENPLDPLTQAHLRLRDCIQDGKCRQNCCFRMISVPYEYNGMRYVDLFKDLVLNHNLLPIGLFRQGFREQDTLEPGAAAIRPSHRLQAAVSARQVVGREVIHAAMVKAVKAVEPGRTACVVLRAVKLRGPTGRRRK